MSKWSIDIKLYYFYELLINIQINYLIKSQIKRDFIHLNIMLPISVRPNQKKNPVFEFPFIAMLSKHKHDKLNVL